MVKLKQGVEEGVSMEGSFQKGESRKADRNPRAPLNFLRTDLMGADVPRLWPPDMDKLKIRLRGLGGCIEDGLSMATSVK
jgi:hypothetical protein